MKEKQAREGQGGLHAMLLQYRTQMHISWKSVRERGRSIFSKKKDERILKIKEKYIIYFKVFKDFLNSSITLGGNYNRVSDFSVKTFIFI